MGANVISLLFHPVWMPTLLFGLIFMFIPSLAKPLSETGMWMVLGAVFVTTCVFPLASLLVFRLTGTLSSFKMEDRRERLNPFLAVAMFYGVTTYMLAYKLNLNFTLVALMAIITVLTFFLTLISRFYKISMHSAGICGMIGLLFGLAYKLHFSQLFYPLVGAILLAGLVMSARLYLDTHRPSEVLWGAAFGFTLCFISSLFLL